MEVEATLDGGLDVGTIEDTHQLLTYKVPTCSRKTAKLVRHVSSFALTSPKMLRVTPAHRALCGLGYAMRQGPYSSTEWYHFSSEAEQIPQFWTHSWRGRVWFKIALLHVICNGFAALVLGTLVVVFTSIPIVKLGLSIQWALLAGLVTSCLGLVLWRPSRKIFFDKICIAQKDPKLQAEGVVNVGAAVKNSQSMLVCWDPTYLSRLWCVLEVAAFLKTHENAAELIIRPTSWGPLAIVLFGTFWAWSGMSQWNASLILGSLESEQLGPMTVALVYSAVNAVNHMLFMPWISHFWRSHLRDLEKACTQLSDFRFDRDVSCHCCAIGHVNPITGKAMICDHETIGECLRIWFGSTSEFEQVIRDRVAPTFKQSFRKHPLPYNWILGATVPTLWISICNAVQAAHDGSDFLALQIFCNLSFWLAGFPILLHIERLGRASYRGLHS
ncbi:unnamed protein product [Symbiodinium sp. CCMP2592]|nr:unnamed protein product [Symbiodinium sp. CCMP2592]